MFHWPSLPKPTSVSVKYLWALRVCNLGERLEEIKPGDKNLSVNKHLVYLNCTGNQ